MPWAIVIRLLARLAASLFFWRIATNRRRAYAGGQPVPGATPKARIDAQAAVMAVRNFDPADLARAADRRRSSPPPRVLLVAGVTIVILTPRWLGAILLAGSARHRLRDLVRGPRPRRRRADAEPAPPRRAAAEDGHVLSLTSLRGGAGGVSRAAAQLVSALVRASRLSRSLGRCQIRCDAVDPSRSEACSA